MLIEDIVTLLTVTQISEIFDVGGETVRRWIREDKLEAERRRGRKGSSVTLEAVKDFVSHQQEYQRPFELWKKSMEEAKAVTPENGDSSETYGNPQEGIEGIKEIESRIKEIRNEIEQRNREIERLKNELMDCEVKIRCTKYLNR